MVRDFFEEYKWDGRPWIICGMGPSFRKLTQEEYAQYNVLGINKVVRETPVDLCHIIDAYIVDKVKDSLSDCKYLVIPYWPHFGFRPHFNLTLREFSRNMPDDLKDKLLGYNLSTMRAIMTLSPVIFAQYFNAEASLNIIAALGCKVVRAVGIDGGTVRSEVFSDHGPCDPRGFDLQWDGMAKTIVRNGIDYQNLDGQEVHPKLRDLCESLSATTAPKP